MASILQDLIQGAAACTEDPDILIDYQIDCQCECTPGSSLKRRPGMIETIEVPAVTAERALGIAQADAATAYRDLSQYRIRLELESDGWHIDYELKDPHMKGGGPHYVIDRLTGALLSRRYEQ
jgi:hypothetical protein